MPQVMQMREMRKEYGIRRIESDIKPLFISDAGGNIITSTSVLSRSGLILLTYQRAFSLFPEQITELDENWFYLRGNGNMIRLRRNVIREKGIFTFDHEGELAPLTGAVPLERKVRVFPGNRQLSLGVGYGHDENGEWWFTLDGSTGPHYIAKLIVGEENGIQLAIEETGNTQRSNFNLAGILQTLLRPANSLR